MSLAHLRAHVEQWRGLNHADATELLDLLEGTARMETAVQTYNEPMTPDMPSQRMEFIPVDEAKPGDWCRVVGPWRQV